ncbi:MAG: ABC transporter permease [Pseudonocardia sp.]|nr:ABC transporter permease [Pseudonocardia sp.]
MTRLVGKRLLAVVPVMLIVSLLSFALVALVPGDAAATLGGPSATVEQIAAIRANLGLDEPIVTRYLGWLGHAVTGDLGRSLFSDQPVLGAIGERLPVTLTLAVGALVVAVVLGLPAGLFAALNRGRWQDRTISAGAAGSLSVPNYFVGMVLIIVVSVSFGWLPATGYTAFAADPAEWFRHLVLPCIALGLVPAAVLARQLRGALVGVLAQDYMRTAEAKGLRGDQVLLKHALKNAAIAPITAVGTQFALVLGGSVVVEQVFGISGLGALVITAVQQRDIPLIQGIVIVAAVLVQVVNIAVDLSYGWLNPRVRVA